MLAVEVVLVLFFVNFGLSLENGTRRTSGTDRRPCEKCDPNPDQYLSAPQMIRRHGYTPESHVVETSDGYLLTLHRIRANAKGVPGKLPVFLQHGLLSSSADWLLTGNKSLAFLLSDLEYDVWLGNARGNTYSKAHAYLPPDTDEFWNFTFHEMGIYDVRAMLNYVTNVTNANGEIIYIGHSMGTTMFYVYSSTFPKLANATVKMMVSLAPIAYMTHLTSPIRYLAPWANDFEWLAERLGFRQFLPNGKIMRFLSYDCDLLNIDSRICEQVIFAICGFDKNQFDLNLLPVVLSHAPAGSSTKTVIHYAQEIHHNGDFMEFDYGTQGNLAKYGRATPPTYNLTNIQVPIYFMYADNDWLSNPTDVYRLANRVQNYVGMYEVPLDTFNHVDFLWAKDAPKLVYNNLINVIKKY